MSQSTPTRRSRRSEIFIPTPSKQNSAALHDAWIDDPLGILATQPDRDLTTDQELDEDFNWKTYFYKGFTRRKPSNSAFKGKGKAKASDEEEFAVGDTILVRGSFKETHVGVIAALWEVRPEDDDEDEDASDGSSKVALVHWFLKPRELPKTGAARQHRNGEIYYTVEQSVVIPITSILSHCNVLSPTQYAKTAGDKFQSTTAPTWTWAHDTENFLCDTAFKDGLHCDLNWDRHRQVATQTALNAPELARDLWKLDMSATRKDRSQRTKGNVAEKRTVKAPKAEPSLAVKETVGEGDDASQTTESGEDSDEDSVSDVYTHEDGDEEQPEEDDDRMSDVEQSPDEDRPEDDPMSDSGSDTKDSRSKKRRRLTTRAPQTPSSKRRRQTRAVLTPTSKAAVAARKNKRGKLRIAQPTTYETARADREALTRLPKDAHLRAMHLLHVAARPDALPGRDQEFNDVLASVLSVLEEGTGGCIYISGVPGTGKTATVHAVVRELQKMAMNNETNPFTYVEINGLRLPEPSAAYAVLWEAVAGHESAKEGHLRISSKEALKKLDRYFGGGRTGPAGGAYVILMDELDQLVTDKQDVVYNFFNWPNLPNSRLVVIAVSNTHDLPERVMSAKVKSRLGMERIQFHPYTRDQLVDIVNSRLTASRDGLDVTANVIHEDAVKYASARVAAVNGDARRVLDISRRAVETVHNPGGQSRIVKMAEVTAVIKAMQNSPTAAYLKECSFIERVLLAALLKCKKREGVDDIKWGDVTQQCTILFEQLREDLGMPRPNQDRLRLVAQSLVASRAVIMESGPQAERKAMQDRLIAIDVEPGEVIRALSDVGGPKWENVLGT